MKEQEEEKGESSPTVDSPGLAFYDVEDRPIAMDGEGRTFYILPDLPKPDIPGRVSPPQRCLAEWGARRRKMKSCAWPSGRAAGLQRSPRYL
jgi:hypothetical protein